MFVWVCMMFLCKLFHIRDILSLDVDAFMVLAHGRWYIHKALYLSQGQPSWSSFTVVLQVPISIISSLIVVVLYIYIARQRWGDSMLLFYLSTWWNTKKIHHFDIPKPDCPRCWKDCRPRWWGLTTQRARGVKVEEGKMKINRWSWGEFIGWCLSISWMLKQLTQFLEDMWDTIFGIDFFWWHHLSSTSFNLEDVYVWMVKLFGSSLEWDQ